MSVSLALLIGASIAMLLHPMCRQWLSRRVRLVWGAAKTPAIEPSTIATAQSNTAVQSPHEVLRMIIDGAPLAQVLRCLCRLADSTDPQVSWSVAPFDERLGALGPSTVSRLAAQFAAAMDGDIGVSGRGSAIAAALRRETVLSENTLMDPDWASSRDLAAKHSVRSSWSLPVFGSGSELVAVITAYCSAARLPTPAELSWTQVLADLASLAIVHDRARKLLSENATRLELAQDIARLGYWERDLLADRTVATEVTSRLLGLDLDTGFDIDRLVENMVPEDRPAVLAACHEVQTNSPLSAVEFRLEHPDAGTRHLLAQRRAFRDNSGRIVKVIGTVQDVTEQRRVAANLWESEERFRMVAEHTGQLILDCRLDAGQVHCAGAVREILGEEATAGAFPLDIWRRLVHPEDIAVVEQSIRRVLHGERVSVACRVLRFDGQMLDVEATGSAVINAQGRATRIIATVSNISDRRRAEAERQRYLTQLAFLADAARKVNSVLSVAELLRIITDIARDLVGAHAALSVLAPDEGWREGLRSVAVSERYAGLESGVFEIACRTIVDEASVDDGFAPLRRPRAAMFDDEPTDLATILDRAGVLSVPFRDSAGRARGALHVADKREGDFGPSDERVLGQLADLASVGIENARLYAELESRVRRRTQELEQSNRELEAFSYSVSHDLRGPLRAISGFTGLLRERHYQHLDEESRRYLDRIQAGTLRMSGLIDDLLELGRVTRMELRRESVDLSLLAENTAARLSERYPQRVAEISIEPGQRVHGDLRLLEIVLENLFDNAWKFTAGRARAEIRFGVHLNGQERAFFVQDNGVGFDPQYASNLFGVFQRLHSGADFPGTGVGLATVQRIVQRHGGRIWATAEAERGAIFYFTVPGER